MKKSRGQIQEPDSEQLVISHTHLVEILAEARNFNTTLREWKRVKHAYRLADESYLFSWVPYVPDQPHEPIDFDSIEKEARELRRKLQEARRQYWNRPSN